MLEDDSFTKASSCQQALEATKMTLSKAVMLVHLQPHAAVCHDGCIKPAV